jgi:hypothetical protein
MVFSGFLGFMKKFPSLIILAAVLVAFSFGAKAQNAPVSWTVGSFGDDTVLSLIPNNQVVYAVNLGSDNAFTTANLYSFTPNNQVNIVLENSNFNIDGPFNPNTGTSVDSAFNSVLGSATFGSSTYTFQNLQVGQTYQVLLLRTDTRAGAEFAGRTFQASGGGNTSATQQYAFDNGGATLGGYAYGTFVANATTQVITVSGSADGGMLNAAVLGAVPEPSTVALMIVGGAGVVSLVRRRRRI